MTSAQKKQCRKYPPDRLTLKTKDWLAFLQLLHAAREVKP